MLGEISPANGKLPGGRRERQPGDAVPEILEPLEPLEVLAQPSIVDVECANFSGLLSALRTLYGSFFISLLQLLVFLPLMDMFGWNECCVIVFFKLSLSDRKIRRIAVHYNLTGQNL